MSAHPWRTDHPAPNRLVEVWYYTHLELATWDGDGWRTPSGAPLPGVTHWRAVEATADNAQ